MRRAFMPPRWNDDDPENCAIRGRMPNFSARRSEKFLRQQLGLKDLLASSLCDPT